MAEYYGAAMAKTRVEGNSVHIDDSTYSVKTAGAGQYAVFDEFGMQLGYFTVRGRVVTPEDYGVEGAHPVVQIGRLWAAVHLFKEQEKSGPPPTKGLCRMVTHEKIGEADLDKARNYRAWMRKQPGCKASWFVADPVTGKGVSFSVWENRAMLASLSTGTPPGDAVELPGTAVELFPIVEDP
jgi:hypothetical protein